jgi:positive regulator of sigma E activity
MSTFKNTHPRPVEEGADLVEATGVGLRVAEVVLLTLAGLLVSPPLLILAVVVVVPTAAIAALVAVIVGVVLVPISVARRVRAHHRTHGSTVFLHRFGW